MDIATVWVSVSGPVANAGDDTTLNKGESAQLSGTGGGAYSWYPPTGISCTTCQNITVSPQATTTYTLLVTDLNGCSSVDEVTVTVKEDCGFGDIFVPNAFSPNADGENELECLYGKCIQSFNFTIYDRWGGKVFSAQGDTSPKGGEPIPCWDGIYKGKPMNSDVFVYYLQATLLNGEEIIKTGNISLIK